MDQVTKFPRKRGRPRKTPDSENALPLISREMVVACAYELCETVDIENLSLDLLSKTLGVSPTTIRHHMKSWKALTPALLELLFTDIVERLPPLTGNWRVDLEGFMMAYMSMKLRKRGFSAYFFEHRFAPELDPFLSPPARAVLTRALHILRAAGLTTRDAALGWHLMVHLLSSIAYTNARGLTPADHAEHFEKMASAGENLDSEHAILSTMRFISFPMVFQVISGMLRHAIEVKFEFVNEVAQI